MFCFMKKIVYLCALVLLSLNVMAQLNSGDNNWYSVIDEQFTGTGRSWNSCFNEDVNQPIWQVKCPETTTGVTTNNHNHHALQTYQCLFNNGMYSDNKMRLCATYTGGPQICGEDYQIPDCGNYHCDTVFDRKIYYHTGNIQTIARLHFGYFEVRCAFPVHTGAHAAFWLWGCGPHSYEEIDIVEYSKADSQNDIYYGYSSGIWFNPNSTAWNYQDNIYKQYEHLPSNGPDIKEMHVYGCEWLPDRVIFYRDGIVTGECYDRDNIPQNTKWLKMGYYINDDIMNPYPPSWQGSDTLTIDYIKYYKLRTDCNNDINIQTQQQLSQLNTVKRSVVIGNTNGLVLNFSTNKVVRATESITINGPFELQSGGELTLIVHECPE